MDNGGTQATGRSVRPDRDVAIGRRSRGDVQISMTEGAPTVEMEREQSVLARDLVNDDEIIILMLRPSLLFIPLASLGSLMMIAIFSLLLALAAAKLPNVVGWSETSAFALGATLGILRIFWQGLDWMNRLFVLTDQRVVRRMGVLRVSVFEAPLRNIQHTSVFFRIRERLFGLGSIGFATSGSDVFDAYWVMLRQPFDVHKTVVETIRRYGRHS